MQMVAMEWSRAEILKFIDLYKSKHVLWDSNHPNHHNRRIKSEAWYDISIKMDASEEECRRKLNSLLASFRRERSKVRKSIRVAEDSSQVYKSTWFAYKTFSFIHKTLATSELLDVKNESIGLEEESIENMDDEDVSAGSDSIQQEKVLPTEEVSVISPSPPSLKRKWDKIATSNNTIKIVNPSTEEKDDECRSFGNFIVNKLKRYSNRTKNAVQHAISDIIFNADEGRYEEN